MAFPDAALANQWPALGEEQNQTTMAARVDANFNLLVPRVSDSGYTTASLGNSWVAFGAPYATPAYRLKGGWTAVEGGMKSGTSASAIFTLPVGMRPLSRKLFIVASGTGTAGLIVDTNGVVSVSFYTTGGSNASVLLDQICFIAEQ